MNQHLCPTGPVPLNARPETVKIRERLNTQKTISQSLAEELGEANRILNWISSQHHIIIHQADGYYTVNCDKGFIYGRDLRQAILESI